MAKFSFLVALVLAAGCGRHSPAQDQEPTPSLAAASAVPAPDAPHYGDVMTEVGRRFELVGRAAQARRFRLAAYEIGEMDEALDDDLPRAQPPRKGDPKKLAALIGELEKQQLPALEKAVRSRDSAKVADAFAEAAGTCNACHAATGHDFVQIPTDPGKSVPLLDPRPAAAPAPPAH